jgi:hypothetical protein
LQYLPLLLLQTSRRTQFANPDSFFLSMMEELYGLQSTSSDYSLQVPSENMAAPAANYYHPVGFTSPAGEPSFPVFGSEQMFCGSSVSDAASMVAELHQKQQQQQQQRGGVGDHCNRNNSEEVSCAIRAKIASHPLYPKLLEAYIDCQKVYTLIFFATNSLD